MIERDGREGGFNRLKRDELFYLTFPQTANHAETPGRVKGGDTGEGAGPDQSEGRAVVPRPLKSLYKHLIFTTE